MAEYLVIRLAPDVRDPVSWIVADDTGARRGAPGTGSLDEAARRAEGRDVIVLVPSTAVFSTSVDLPIRNRARLLAALPYALEENLADDVDRLHFATGARRNDGRVPVAVVSVEQMNAWIEALAAAGIAPVRMVPEHGGLARIPGTLSLLIAGDTIMFNDGEDNEFALQDVGPADALTIAGAVDPQKPSPHHLQVYCEETDQQRFVDDWRRLRERLASVHVNLLPDGPLPRLAVTVAAGLGIDLLQGPYGTRTDLRALLYPWRHAAVLLLALGIVAVGSSAAELYSLARDEASLKAQFTEEYRAIRPDDTQEIVDPVGIVSSIRRSLGAPASSGVFLPSLEALSAALQQQSNVQLEAISYRAGVVDVRLSAPDVATLDSIQRSISGVGRFEASIQSTDQVGDGDRISSRIQIRETGS